MTDWILYIIAACLISIVLSLSFIKMTDSIDRVYKSAFLAGCQDSGKVSREKCLAAYEEKKK